ncbi:hypothetical protein [Schaalia cardiffensis]|uniref:DUF7666 domain-containing protein n=1 Tax=Schaalia cardiffensis TaxID=181487 RepID=UPI0023F12295|nr:hypothetical protein [Schaalia cardiffensis]
MIVVVHTQEELNKALRNPDYEYSTHKIVIDSPGGVWVCLDDSMGKDIEAGGNATVRAWGNATVRAWGNATVEAWGNATVRAGGNATVRAWGNATVDAWGNATVEARGNATVEAGGNATVRAWGNATVDAWGNATVEARGNATVEAGGNATVDAGLVVMVRVCSQTVAVSGGVIVDMTTIDEKDPNIWCSMHLVQVDDNGDAHLFKAVDDALNAGHDYRLTHYAVGNLVDDSDNWRDDHMWGGGLHASPTPFQAWQHFEEATRFLEVTCPVEDLRPIDDTKAKAPRFEVLREVDLHGNEVAQ